MKVCGIVLLTGSGNILENVCILLANSMDEPRSQMVTFVLSVILLHSNLVCCLSFDIKSSRMYETTPSSCHSLDPPTLIRTAGFLLTPGAF